jgi:DNA repair exonuclease SbcCD nuclease subunit
MSVRLLHTADVHLGATFKVLGERGRDQARQVRDTFARAIGLALEERVHAVLIAGDLFDSPPAARAQAAFVSEQLARLGEARIPVCAIAGNHDALGEGSRGLWQALAARHPHLTVFGPDPQVRVFPDCDLAVVGRSVASRLEASSPLAGFPPARPARFVVGLAHGSVQRPDLPARFGTIAPEDIARAGVDYLALGDWHSPTDVSSGGVTAWYSGAPEMIDLGEGNPGHVLLVTLPEPGRADVEVRRVGRRRVERLVLDLGTSGGAEGVLQTIRRSAGPDVALVVTLTGLVGVADRISVEALREELEREFFRLEIRDESHLRPEAVDPDRYPENTVLGRFVRRMREEIARREGEERSLAEEALLYGVGLLEEREGAR